MINLKSLAISVITIFLMVPVIFANGEIITKSPYGEYVYETTIKALVDKGVSKEIKLVNKSSYPLKFISCTVRINGRDHDMRAIPLLRLGVTERFDGFFKDDMTREFSKFFGKDGRLTHKNNNFIKFTFKFMDHDADVAITDVYGEKNDLCFVVSDVAKGTDSTDNNDVKDEQTAMSEQPAVVTAPEVAPLPGTKISESKPEPDPEPIAESVPKPTSDDTIVVIEGKSYLLHDGKAYLLQ